MGDRNTTYTEKLKARGLVKRTYIVSEESADYFHIAAKFSQEERGFVPCTMVNLDSRKIKSLKV